MDSLVTSEWLAANLASADLRIVDCTWFLPGDGRNARADHEAAHIPGAVFLDLDATADPSHPAPMMLPTAAAFARQIAGFGIGDHCRIVLYDASPHHTAARGWAMFRSFGMDTAILDGGFATWQAEDRPMESGTVAAEPASLAPPAAGLGIADMAQVRAALATGTAQLVDARSAGRFAGLEPEPRAGVAPGHMPGAHNLPHARLFTPDGRWKRGEALRAIFAEAGVDFTQPVIATCGSGITACAVAFALHLLGEEAPVYDGSWAEWGADPATPKVTGHSPAAGRRALCC